MSNVKTLKITSLRALLVASLFTITSLASLFAEGNVDNGKKLFKDNCARCHYITDKKFVGPGLKDVRSRWDDEANLYSWIKNNADLRASGNKYANQIFDEFSGSLMPNFPLTDAEIGDILAYIDAGEPKTDVVVDPNAPKDPSQPEGKGGMSQSTLMLILAGVAIVMLILARALSNVSKAMDNVGREKEGLPKHPEPKPFDIFTKIWQWLGNNKKVSLVLGLVVISWLSYKAFVGLMGIGVYTGYQPHQPIKFSHKLHAGQNGIDCKYCHSSADDSRHANIPSANICMNCHKAVNEGPVHGKKEISKIYASIGWNPVDGKYFDNYSTMNKDEVKAVFKEWLIDSPEALDPVVEQVQQPIQWVQVHNLPDHVFFSHQQHVVVGKLECAECHGKVEEMEEIQQVSPLTMGWCISCHRKTEVQYADNGYYDRLHNYYKEHYGEYEMRKGQAFTVEKIGGLECSKCHY